MLISLVILVHVLVSFILIISVLLQSGKGADLAGAFGGGGSQTAFGSRGPATFLSQLTTFAAVTFMVTSLALSLFYTRQPSVLSNLPMEDSAPGTPAPTLPDAPGIVPPEDTGGAGVDAVTTPTSGDAPAAAGKSNPEQPPKVPSP